MDDEARRALVQAADEALADVARFVGVEDNWYAVGLAARKLERAAHAVWHYDHRREAGQADITVVELVLFLIAMAIALAPLMLLGGGR